MDINIDIRVPNDNTNTPHGTINLTTDERHLYIYITVGESRIAVSREDIRDAVSIL